MKLVVESLDQLYEIIDYNNDINEAINFNKLLNYIPKIKDKRRKLSLLALLFLMGSSPSIEIKDENLENNPHLIDLADDPHLTTDEILGVFDFMKGEFVKSSEGIIQMSPEIIEDINKVKPNRFSEKKIPQYNQFDEQIISATEDLKIKGENPHADLIKTIMLIETGMNPRKNKWGFEGFPQTKEYIINGINQKYGTKFTLKDMYDPYKSAQYIHYFLDAIQKNRYVNNTSDMIIAYNWGIGNLIKYKKGKKKLPNQSKDYIKILKTLERHFSSS